MSKHKWTIRFNKDGADDIPGENKNRGQMYKKKVTEAWMKFPGGENWDNET